MAVVGLASMLIIALVEGLPLRDPDARYVGSPLALIGVIAGVFLVLDLIPRARRASRAEQTSYLRAIGAVFRERWWGMRGAVVVVSLLSFYATYLSYRNLKSFMPFVNGANHDQALLDAERFFFFGNDPAAILHGILGTGAIAHVLSFIYLAFLTFVPLSLGFALIWSSRLRVGVWYVTTLSICWLLGALSYYLVPALGPAYAEKTLFYSLPDTGVSRLQNTLFDHRAEVMFDPQATSAVQSIAAFASLHVAVIFAAALLAHLAGAPRALRIGMWTFLGFTSIATIYFGWHYLVDDAAGLVIGVVAVYGGARLCGIELPARSGSRVPQRSASAA
ncbi:MAG: phosphatase PAP2 family protein [Solirubrobacterales bacterium]